MKGGGTLSAGRHNGDFYNVINKLDSFQLYTKLEGGCERIRVAFLESSAPPFCLSVSVHSIYTHTGGGRHDQVSQLACAVLGTAGVSHQ